MVGIPPIAPYSLPTPDELPENTASWRVDPGRAVLLVHDMQRFFLRPLPETLRDALVDSVALLVDGARAAGVPIAYTAQPGGWSDEDRGLLKDFWGPGMRAVPADRAVVDRVAPAPDDWLLTKWRYSAFFRSDLLARLRAANRDQLVVCGVYAHVGVLMSAVEAFTNDLETFLAGDAVADFSLAHHRMALDYAAGRCAVVLPAKEVFG